MLSGEVQQVSEQLARATVYLLMDELVRYPASEQPYHLARIVRDKRFGFPVHLLQVKELDLDDDQRRRVVEGDTVMALGRTATRSASSPASSTRPGCWSWARCSR